MKTILVVLATVLLGVIIWFFVLGDNNSLKTEATRIFNSSIQQLQSIE